MSATRVLLVEDHTFFRELMATLLERQADRFQVVAEVGTADEAVAACRELGPDLVVLDLNLAGGRGGTDALASLRRAHPPARILICSGSCDEGEIAAALRAGPDGFVDKGADRPTFLAAVAAVASGGHYLCPRSARISTEMGRGHHGEIKGRKVNPTGKRKPSAASALASLTPRERETLALVAGGHTSKEAADTLGVSLGTVVTHRGNLMRKLGTHNAAELTRYAFEHKVQPRQPQR